MRARDYLQALETLPYGTLQDILGKEQALILTPHPDDETLGCGGLIATACALGTPPLVAVLTDGSGSHPGSRDYPPQRLSDLRAMEVAEAAARLGLPDGNLFWLGLPDGELSQHIDAAVAHLEARGRAHGTAIGTVIGPWRWDPHCDHEAAAEIATRLAGKLALPVLSYPVWGWLLPDDTEIAETKLGGWRLDISAQSTAKRHAVAAHTSQHGQVIHDAAEGFVLPPALLAACGRPFEVFISP